MQDIMDRLAYREAQQERDDIARAEQDQTDLDNLEYDICHSQEALEKVLIETQILFDQPEMIVPLLNMILKSTPGTDDLCLTHYVEIQDQAQKFVRELMLHLEDTDNLEILK